MKAVFNPGLYAITAQRYPDLDRLGREVRSALEGGAAMVQFRDKSGDFDWRLEATGHLMSICAEFGVPLIINDDVELAASVGAAGVHLGRNDESPGRARAMLGADFVLGLSCYNSLDRAREAAEGGADYLAFGSVHASASKPDAVHCPLETLTQARTFGLPLVAIGGITPDNGRAIVQAGADSLAVISAVFDAPDIREAARSFARIWIT